MNYYVEIKTLSDLETTAPTLMNHLCSKLHRQLGQMKQNRIGISFPKVKKTLGDTLRLHGTDDDLYQLMQADWLGSLRGYVRCSDVCLIPSTVTYRTVRRVQIKSMHNKRQRSIAKGWLTREEAMQKMPDHLERAIDLPFLQFRSLSTKQVMRVYIEHGEITRETALGSFSSYGLSSTAKVPWF